MSRTRPGPRNLSRELVPYPVHVRDHDNTIQGVSTPRGTPSADGSHPNKRVATTRSLATQNTTRSSIGFPHYPCKLFISAL